MPIKSFVHQRYWTEPLVKATEVPAVDANPYEAYLRLGQGAIEFLSVAKHLTVRNRVCLLSPFRMGELSTPSGFSDNLRDRVKPLLPILERRAFVDEKVGLISFAMDGEPILGSLPELPGLLVGASFHSGGFGYNPVAGTLLADWQPRAKLN